MDAGCGFGHLAKYLGHCDYTGVDTDPERVEWARKRLGENSRRRFLVANVLQTGLPEKGFDKALGYGLLHHLQDEEAAACVLELSRLTKGRIVFSDPVYSKVHLLNNLLCRLDRGAFVRTEQGYLDILKRRLTVAAHRSFHSRNGLAKYFMTVSTPLVGDAVAA